MAIPSAYLAIILIWSTTPLAIQWSTMGVGYTFAVLARMLLGLVICGALMLALRVRLPFDKRALKTYLAAGLGLFGAMFSTYWASRYITSGLIAVLFGLTPIVTGVIAALWLKESPLTTARITGMFAGLVGLVLIFDTGYARGIESIAGIGAVIIAVFTQAGSLVWIKRIDARIPALAVTAGALTVSVPLYAATWLLLDGEFPRAVSARAGLAIVYLGVFGSVLGFNLYFYIAKHLEAGQIALINLVTPVIALLLGRALNAEDISASVWIGTACIVLGLLIHQWSAIAPALLRYLPGRS